ncbi:MAG: hypothetical protein JWN46_1022, partial [Acidimicrobiales bacterium]|nr:hypothetical protein [Acidimicrobiales bacterium]
MSCEHVAANAAEFTLGLLDGPARAGVVDHLAQCAACRRLIEAEAAQLDQLLTAGPMLEPPTGFEGRVLERIAQEPQPVEPQLVPVRSRAAVAAPTTMGYITAARRPARPWVRRVAALAAAVVL